MTGPSFCIRVGIRRIGDQLPVEPGTGERPILILSPDMHVQDLRCLLDGQPGKARGSHAMRRQATAERNDVEIPTSK